jgi:urease accessory protein
MKNAQSLLALLQLVSPTLPVGAYTYSEGLETLSQLELLTATSLEDWLRQELRYGAIQVEAAILIRSHHAAVQVDIDQLNYWNQWLSALRETEEMRQQSWQMGQALWRLLRDLQPASGFAACQPPYNFAIAFAIAAATFEIEAKPAVLGYLQSWAANLINAAVRLVPLGQTQGQQILLNLAPVLADTAEAILHLSDEQLECCSWGVSLASMNHETLYSRLFRS